MSDGLPQHVDLLENLDQKYDRKAIFYNIVHVLSDFERILPLSKTQMSLLIRFIQPFLITSIKTYPDTILSTIPMCNCEQVVTCSRTISKTYISAILFAILLICIPEFKGDFVCRRYEHAKNLVSKIKFLLNEHEIGKGLLNNCQTLLLPPPYQTLKFVIRNIDPTQPFKVINCNFVITKS